ncbi:MAG: hypothetical protein ILO36_02635 [Abditibacteriota bacterium]|nr:hypothetical protein [Abditibacteriota bacterium]
MTKKELNLATFRRENSKVLWQPRLEEWYFKNKQNGTLPEKYRDTEHLELYDLLDCSVRYAASAGVIFYHAPDAGIRGSEEIRGNRLYAAVETPAGSLTTVYHLVFDPEGKVINQRIESFPVKTPEELRVAAYITENTLVKADPELFGRHAALMGDRGEPAIILGSAGYTELIKNWAGLINATYLTCDCPDEVEAFLEACDRRDDRMLDAALQLDCKVFNLGDHATDEFTPPPILKKYMLPRWQRLSEHFHRAGRFVHSHWDGNSHTMLPYLKESGLDSVEALTFAPMGNITPEEVKQAVGDEIVCLDLLPAIYFLKDYPAEELLEFTRKVIDMFAPRLILGVSDEISSVGEIEKIEAVSRLVRELNGE